LKLIKQISVILIILFCLTCEINVSGDTVLNKYVKVIQLFNYNKLDPDSFRVRPEDVGVLKTGDTIVIYQAKGATINYSDGNINNYQYSGNFEYHVISNVIGDIILLPSALNADVSTYNAGNFVQAVKVASFNKKYVTQAKLTADPWDSVIGIGGIFAMMADTLILGNDIDVSAKGFKGGNPDTTHSFHLSCSTADKPGYSRLNFTYGAKDSSGLKGESIVVFDSLYMRGKMCLLSGGGGGNAYHSGGGGGSSWGAGGTGGYEIPICSNDIAYRGQAGKSLSGFLTGTNKAIFGGGGGCSTQKQSYHASKGGNGGGIVLLIANVLIPNGHKIISNGGSVNDALCTAGGGGGGGGGAILLDVNQIKSPKTLTLQVEGGHGGNTGLDTFYIHTTGPGGGGGGGYIFYNWSAMPDSVILDYSFGPKGYTKKYDRKPTNGGPGNYEGNKVMPIKDFLFNIMPAGQTVCSGILPGRINASNPMGGGGPGSYVYTWLRTRDHISWDTIGSAVTYQPPVFTDTIFTTYYYQRIVYSLDVNTGDTIWDRGSELKIYVYPAIGNNSISIVGQDTLCKGIPFPQLKGTNSLKKGDGTYHFQWQDYISVWKDTLGLSDVLYSIVPNQIATSKFRRIVSSGVCRDTSTVLKMTVLPSIRNDSIGESQYLCKGDTAKYLRSKLTLAGGNGNYSYLWQLRKNSTAWGNATVPNNKNFYIVPLTPDTLQFRRFVYSGENMTCKDTSNILYINMLDSVINNIISGTQTICGNTNPSNFIGRLPKGGDHLIYHYQWEKSLDGLNWDSIYLVTSKTDTLYNPGLINPGNNVHLTAYNYFKRIVRSGPNDCCKDTSNTIVVTIRPYIKNNFIVSPNPSVDTVICYNQSPDSIVASFPIDGNGPYFYAWEKSLDNMSWINALPDTTKQGYSCAPLTVTTYFRRKITSGICKSFSDTLKITVLNTIQNNAITSSDNYVCKGSQPKELTSSALSGGDMVFRYAWLKSTDNIVWSAAPGLDSTSQYYQPDTTSIKLYFKRVVKSGLHDCCIDTSSVFALNIHELPTDSIGNFNDSLCENFAYKIHHVLTGKPDFSLSYTDGVSNYDTAGINTLAYNQYFKPVNKNVLHFKVLSLTDGNNCLAKMIVGSGILDVFYNPKADITATNDSVCGLEEILNAHSSYGNGIWKSSVNVIFQDSATMLGPTAVVPDYGQYVFTWLENNGGCKDSAKIKINFFKQPTSVEAGPNQEGPFIFSTTLHATAPIVGVASWSSPDNSIYIQDKTDPATTVDSLKFGKNYFIWTISNGACKSISDSVIINTTDIRVPNGFSPNSDGVNDTFKIVGLKYTKNAELTIINKWGKVVYQSNDYKNDWTGKFNGTPLPEDTYFFILKVINRVYKGFVVIRR